MGIAPRPVLHPIANRNLIEVLQIQVLIQIPQTISLRTVMLKRNQRSRVLEILKIKRQLKIGSKINIRQRIRNVSVKSTGKTPVKNQPIKNILILQIENEIHKQIVIQQLSVNPN